jgi:hypothetical protein
MGRLSSTTKKGGDGTEEHHHIDWEDGDEGL